MLYWSTIFVISSVFFDIDFVQVKVEIILHDDSSRFRYSTGYVFFVSSSDALFSFYICSHSKAEKVKFSE